MNQTNDSLGRRLRDAAVERTREHSERVDDFVLDADGVIDLREFDRSTGERSIAAPAAALASIKGRLGDAAEVADLYDESEPEPPRWRRGLFARRSTPEPTPPRPAPTFTLPAPTPRVPPISRLSMVPLSTDPDPEPAPTAEAAPPTPAPVAAAPDDHHEGAEVIDLRSGTENEIEGRSTPCPRCDGIGRCDLVDRFNQIEFYSCDLCNHMWQQDRR